MNDTYIDTYNLIFQTLHGIYSRQQHAHTSRNDIKAEINAKNAHNNDTHSTRQTA
jgi:hypothetical protein